MKRVEGKVAVVTGGALGIGRAACLLLAREGAKVAVTDIADKEGGKVAEEIKELGGFAKYWHVDTSNEDEVSTAFSSIANEFGSIDILVNNAGIAELTSRLMKFPKRNGKKSWASTLKVFSFVQNIPYHS